MPAPQNLTPADTSETVAPTLAAALRRRHRVVDEIVCSHSPDETEISSVRDRAAGYDLLVIGTLSASMNPAQAALVRALISTGIPAVTAALRTPYDLGVYPESRTHICTYSMLPDSMDALAAALFGVQPFLGVLPVRSEFLEPV
jgi:beta-N-acetylhexosaminidase